MGLWGSLANLLGLGPEAPGSKQHSASLALDSR